MEEDNMIYNEDHSEDICKLIELQNKIDLAIDYKDHELAWHYIEKLLELKEKEVLIKCGVTSSQREGKD